MQFTPQQLTGGIKYASVTRIGNWQEDIALDEAKRDNFLKNAALGSLTLRKQETKLSIFNQIVPLTYAEDGVIRFNDFVILFHESTKGSLACDPQERIVQGLDLFVVTGTENVKLPRARNVFRIVRPPSSLKSFDDDENDEVLKIGQPFCLACNESLLVNPGSNILSPSLFLGSVKRNERMATRSTNRQLVYMSPTLNADAIWYFSKPSLGRINGTERFLAFGKPVTSDNSLLIVHRQTNMLLTFNGESKFQSEFGIEMECFADRSNAPGKLGILSSEFKGLSTPNTLSKPDAPTFTWRVVMSDNENAAIDNRILPPVATVGVIVDDIKANILSQGTFGFTKLRRFLHDLDVRINSDGKLYRDDARNALQSFGIKLDSAFIESVLDEMDKHQLGLIDWRALIRLLRGPAPSRRIDFLENRFFLLSGQSKVIPLNDLLTLYRGPEDFLHALIVHCRRMKSNSATLETFVDYLLDLSPAFADDDSFEREIDGLWRYH